MNKNYSTNKSIEAERLNPCNSYVNYKNNVFLFACN